jgi:hypothetical protein
MEDQSDLPLSNILTFLWPHERFRLGSTSTILHTNCERVMRLQTNTWKIIEEFRRDRHSALIMCLRSSAFEFVGQFVHYLTQGQGQQKGLHIWNQDPDPWPWFYPTPLPWYYSDVSMDFCELVICDPTGLNTKFLRTLPMWIFNLVCPQKPIHLHVKSILGVVKGVYKLDATSKEVVYFHQCPSFAQFSSLMQIGGTRFGKCLAHVLLMTSAASKSLLVRSVARIVVGLSTAYAAHRLYNYLFYSLIE